MSNVWLERAALHEKHEEQKRIYSLLISLETFLMTDSSCVVPGSPDATHYNLYEKAKQFLIANNLNFGQDPARQRDWEKICEVVDYIVAKFILANLGTFEEQ